MQTPCNHQVEDEPKIAFDTESNAFADAADFTNHATFGLAEWGLNGAEQKRAGEAHALEGLANHAWLKGVDVRRDIGQFRHGE